jgi:predicted DNA-binding transcriptional regulator YafY
MRQAIREERKLRIVYRDEEGRETDRVIWPVALAFFEPCRRSAPDAADTD